MLVIACTMNSFLSPTLPWQHCTQARALSRLAWDPIVLLHPQKWECTLVQLWEGLAAALDPHMNAFLDGWKAHRATGVPMIGQCSDPWISPTHQAQRLAWAWEKAAADTHTCKCSPRCTHTHSSAAVTQLGTCLRVVAALSPVWLLSQRVGTPTVPTQLPAYGGDQKHSSCFPHSSSRWNLRPDTTTNTQAKDKFIKQHKKLQ